MTNRRSGGRDSAMPSVSIIILSHNKPSFVKEAVQCVLDQTHQDWEATLMDSGVLLNQGFFNFITDKRIRVIPSGEEAGLNKRKNVASWCFNQWLNSGEARGELIMYLCDDDILYPDAFETFWSFYLQHNREPQAMYASQDIGVVDLQGRTKIVGKRIADRPRGRFCHGGKLDCKVDYLQFCHTRAILDRVRETYGTTEYHPEGRKHFDHADGVFLEQVGALTKVWNVEKILSMNRRTTASVNLDYAEGPLGRFLVSLKGKFKGVRRKFDRG